MLDNFVQCEKKKDSKIVHQTHVMEHIKRYIYNINVIRKYVTLDRIQNVQCYNSFMLLFTINEA